MRQVWRRLLLALVAIGTVIGTTMAVVPTANAWVFNGCRSTQVRDNKNVYYRTGTGITSYYSDVIDSAAASWNAVNVPGFLKKVAQGGQFVVERYNYTHSWYALFTHRCGTNGYYSGLSGIALNSRTMDPFANWQDRFVLIHEMGHYYSLADLSSGNCGTTIMKGDAQTGNSSCSSLHPSWRDDADGINTIY